MLSEKRCETTSWMRSIDTWATSPCGKTSFSTSCASSTVMARPVSDENATTRVSAPSSSRMFVEIRLAMNVSTCGVGDRDRVGVHLLAEDGDAGLEVGRLDVGDEPPLEPRA